MPSNIQTVDRERLEFNTAAKAAFEFLCNLGFTCLQDEPTLVRFESSWCRINIFHGRKSYEIGLEIEPINQNKDKQSYPLSVLLAALVPDEYTRYKCYATHSKDGVLEGTQQLASLFKKCLASELFNQRDIFHILGEKSDEIVKKFSIEVRLEQMRRALEIAWRNKDFKKVVGLLLPLQEHLNDVESTKLEYAKKHMNQT